MSQSIFKAELLSNKLDIFKEGSITQYTSTAFQNSTQDEQMQTTKAQFQTQDENWSEQRKKQQKQVWTVNQMDIQCQDRKSNSTSVVHSAKEVPLHYLLASPIRQGSIDEILPWPACMINLLICLQGAQGPVVHGALFDLPCIRC